MEIIDNLRNEFNSSFNKLKEAEIKFYKSKYPDEEFPIPEIVASFNFKEDTINTYKEFNYPNEYILKVDKRANWNTTAAITIFNSNMNLQSKIIVNAFNSINDTIFHELTHVSDYYSYCKSHNYLNYLELIQLKEFICIYLFSEFRAFYRGILYCDEEIEKRVKYETTEFSKIQQATIDKQNLEVYYYHSIKYISLYCVYLEKCVSKEEITNILLDEDKNILHIILKFLYPLRNKKFSEMEIYFNDFQNILDKMISKS